MWGSTGAMGSKIDKFPTVHTGVKCGFTSVTKHGIVSFADVKDLDRVHRKLVKNMEKNL
jgi:hypothetical protein